jgi:two-component system LytT family response regulator
MLNLKITAVIIDSDLNNLNETRSELKKVEELSIVGTSTDVDKGISLITNYLPNLVFVNMELQKLNGIEFVTLLNKRNIHPEIIFLASNKGNAYDSIKVKPFDYLIQPVSKEVVKHVLDRLKTKFRKTELMRKMDYYTKINAVGIKRVFKQKGGIVIIPLEEIIYCKAELTRTILMLRCGEKIQLSSSIAETIDTINSKDFFRAGRSYCINKIYLRKIDKRQCKCHLYYNEQNWMVPASKNTIVQLEKLNVSTMY